MLNSQGNADYEHAKPIPAFEKFIRTCAPRGPAAGHGSAHEKAKAARRAGQRPAMRELPSPAATEGRKTCSSRRPECSFAITRRAYAGSQSSITITRTPGCHACSMAAKAWSAFVASTTAERRLRRLSWKASPRETGESRSVPPFDIHAEQRTNQSVAIILRSERVAAKFCKAVTTGKRTPTVDRRPTNIPYEITARSTSANFPLHHELPARSVPTKVDWLVQSRQEHFFKLASWSLGASESPIPQFRTIEKVVLAANFVVKSNPKNLVIYI